MKVHKLFHPVATLIVCLALAATPAAAQGFGARAYGMGGAYTAVADDVASLLYNPAGLTASSFEATLGIGSNDFSDLTKFQEILQEDYPDDLNLGLNVLGGVSLGNYGGAVAVDGSARAMGDCEGGPEFCADADYMIRYVVGAGFQAAGLPLDLADLNLGASISLLGGRRLSHTRTNLDAATYWGETVDQRAKGYALNLGARFKATDIVTVGLVAENVLSSLTWEGTRTEGIYTYAGDEPDGSPAETSLDTVKERLDTVYRAGVAIEPPMLGATIAADVASDGSLRFGVEKSFLLNRLAVRAGHAVQDDVRTTTVGLGFNFGPVRVDLAAGSSDGFETVNTMLEGSVRF